MCWYHGSDANARLGCRFGAHDVREGKASVSSKLENVAFARYAICGFACLQGFIVSLLYIGPNRMLEIGGIGFERGDVACMLLFMAIAFGVVAKAPLAFERRLLSRPSLLACSLLLVAASAVSYAALSSAALPMLLEGALLGFPCALVVALWGKALSLVAVEHSVPIIFIGSALGAAVCFVVGAGLMPYVPESEMLLCLLPLGSAFALARIGVFDPTGGSAESRQGDAPVSPSGKAARGELSRFTARIYAGTALYGAATGIMQTFGSDPGMASTPTLPVTFLLFILYCLAALQVASPPDAASAARLTPPDASLSGFGALLVLKGREVAQGAGKGPIDGTYRLAGLLLLGGFLFVSVLEDMGVPGEAVVVSGFLSVMVVLGALFLVMTRLSQTDAAKTFSRGYAALFAGEFAGIALANAIDVACAFGESANLMVALAGLAALISYLFLFTEQDFSALTVAASKADRFEDICRTLAARSALSPRETEVLPLALKGRTAERIASELCISKSTVDTHLRRIYAKCGVHSRQELIDLCEGML